MTVGQLSADQQAFVQQVSTSTGLSPAVVTSWVGAESGWNSSKPGSNYLNVGPGEVYASTSQAAARAAHLINSEPPYAGIRNAIPAGGQAQVAAIGSSPWGTSSSTLSRVYSELTSGGTATPYGQATPALSIPGVGTLPSGSQILAGAGQLALGVVLVLGAIGLVGLGLTRLTGRNVRDSVVDIGSHVGAATAIAGAA